MYTFSGLGSSVYSSSVSNGIGLNLFGNWGTYNTNGFATVVNAGVPFSFTGPFTGQDWTFVLTSYPNPTSSTMALIIDVYSGTTLKDHAVISTTSSAPVGGLGVFYYTQGVSVTQGSIQLLPYPGAA